MNLVRKGWRRLFTPEKQTMIFQGTLKIARLNNPLRNRHDMDQKTVQGWLALCCSAENTVVQNFDRGVQMLLLNGQRWGDRVAHRQRTEKAETAYVAKDGMTRFEPLQPVQENARPVPRVRFSASIASTVARAAEHSTGFFS